MVGQVAQQVVPSTLNSTMGADFFLPSRTLHLLLLLFLLLATFSSPPPPSPSPPGKFFLPSCSIFLALSAPRWHRAGHRSNIQIPIRKKSLMTLLVITTRSRMKMFKLLGKNCRSFLTLFGKLCNTRLVPKEGKIGSRKSTQNGQYQ